MLAIAHTGNRLNKTSTQPNDCTIPLNIKGQIRGAHGSYTVQLASIQLNWTWYPINNENNTIHITRPDGFDEEAVISNGVYTTGAQMATELTSLLQVGAYVVNSFPLLAAPVTYDTLTGKFVFTFNSPAGPPFLVTTIKGDSTAHNVLGILGDTLFTGTVATPATHVADLNHNDMALINVIWSDVQSVVLWGGTDSNSRVTTKRSIFGVAEVPDTWGNNCKFMENAPLFTSTQLPETIVVSIRDTHGALLDNNGVDYTLVFALYDLPGISNSSNHVIVDQRDLFTNLSNEKIPISPHGIGMGPPPEGYGGRATKRFARAITNTEGVDATQDISSSGTESSSDLGMGGKRPRLL